MSSKKLDDVIVNMMTMQNILKIVIMLVEENWIEDQEFIVHEVVNENMVNPRLIVDPVHVHEAKAIHRIADDHIPEIENKT